jgi:hypothetical protein
MIPKPLRQFLYDLQAATDEGRVSWSEGASGDAFVCSRNGHNLHVSYWFNQDEGVSYYNFAITGAKHATFSVSSEEADYRFMENVYSSVQINAGKLADIGETFFD